MDRHLLLTKINNFTARKVARENDLNYFTTRNFMIGRTLFPENDLMEKLDEYCKRVGKELTYPYNPSKLDTLRAKLNHLQIQKVANETGLCYQTIRNFLIGYTKSPEGDLTDKLEEYCRQVGVELKKRCN